MQDSLDLPSIPGLRRVTQSLAMLDAILSPEWEYRYYSFNSAWGPDEEMASMRNGSGDDWFLLLDHAGAAIKGFAHELADGPLLSQNIQAQVPADFSSFLNESAFSMQYATFCYWRKADDRFTGVRSSSNSTRFRMHGTRNRPVWAMRACGPSRSAPSRPAMLKGKAA